MRRKQKREMKKPKIEIQGTKMKGTEMEIVYNSNSDKEAVRWKSDKENSGQVVVGSCF
ncbi:hypothetical protein Godav_028645 [Gossypium davidsonii]|uniref:Uncharacterized protein n=1 Tax=Gossypium davidsonii TaxID=34287 RepID=A0A7J8S1P0_GOSDV|nr:hypothetical protein [Gossypium davidsonii]